MKSKVYLLWSMFFLVSLFSLVSADIISINSAGGQNIVVLSNEIVQGFFFGEIPSEVSADGGGGDARGVLPELCNETFNYLGFYGTTSSFLPDLFHQPKDFTLLHPDQL